MDYIKKYEEWLNNDYFDKMTREELMGIKDDQKEIEDRFYKDLTFGTAGLRGKIGAGTNRMNKYVIASATQGLAEVIKKRGKSAIERGVVIAYDCRHYSDVFAKTAALVLAGNSIKTYLFESLRPTPELSFAVRKLKTIAGIVVTASHNPRDYNGYKVYWEEGSQILSDIASEILEEIQKIKDFSTIKLMEETDALRSSLLNIIGKEIDDEYIEKVKSLSLRDNIDKNINIVYTPLNGTGNIPVRRVLGERGFNNVTVVPEQENPDPDFTTVGYPNPEDINAFEYAQNLGKKVNADLLIATDPDCDRLACMVKDDKGDYIALNGNQTGAILIEYILSTRKEKGDLPSDGVIVKSIVTGDLGKAIAKKYDIDTIEVLTGFKNICGKANEFDKTKEHTFIFGYEESIGYVYGTIVRDKDAVMSSMLLAEAAGYYKLKGVTLLDVLNKIYEKHGYYTEKLISLVLEGIEGQKRIERMMKVYRKDYLKEIDGARLTKKVDYQIQKEFDEVSGKERDIDIPHTNALKFIFDDSSWYAIRPSGTEPKIKIYIYSVGKDLIQSKAKINSIEEAVIDKLNSIE